MHQKPGRPRGGPGRTGEKRGEAACEAVSDEATLARHAQTDWGVGDLLGQALARENMARAWKRVKANKGSAGVDGRTVQALLQVLQPLIAPTFSAHSHGFRPGRSTHGAVIEAQRYVQAGYKTVVDVDLERFFDRINHDILMDRLAKRIADKRVLRLIRRYLQAGILAHGVHSERYEGTPQGGPLSPLLANVLLDEVDRELERRGHRFVRYADDCNVYVRSQRAGERVLQALRGCYAKLALRTYP